jgi:glutathione S-transferase
VDSEPITGLLAIFLFLAERYLEARMVPYNPIQRAKCYSWISYLTGTTHPFFGTMWRPLQ